MYIIIYQKITSLLIDLRGIFSSIQILFLYLSFQINCKSQYTLYSIGSCSSNPIYASLHRSSWNSTKTRYSYFLECYFSLWIVIIENMKHSSIWIGFSFSMPYLLNLSKNVRAVYKSNNPFPWVFFISSNIYESPWLLSKRSSFSLLELLIVVLWIC